MEEERKTPIEPAEVKLSRGDLPSICSSVLVRDVGKPHGTDANIANIYGRWP